MWISIVVEVLGFVRLLILGLILLMIYARQNLEAKCMSYLRLLVVVLNASLCHIDPIFLTFR